MIIKLYTGSYSQDIEALKFGRIIGALWGRAFGNVPQHSAIPKKTPDRQAQTPRLTAL
jgi:hypothetical protein